MTASPPPQPPTASSHRTALFRSARFLGHDTGAHPEHAGRLVAIDAELARAGLLTDRPAMPFGPATDEALVRIHDPDYLELLASITGDYFARLDADTVVRGDSFEVARLAAGAGIAGVDAVLDGAARRAFALVRPPGHHATPTRGMGFCLLNNIAIAAAQALARGVDRVAIFDWDVHHGNGTQDAFYASDRVLFCSVHQSPLYPGTGDAAERGTGAGEGFTLNVPLPPGQPDAVYQRVFADQFLPRARVFQPQLILISAGFDAHAADPIGGMALTDDGFAALATQVTDFAEEVCAGRLVAILEGGYDPPALARSVAAVLRAFDEG